MNRAEAYRILAAELETYSRLGYDRVVTLLGLETSKVVRVGDEEIAITIRVVSSPAGRGTIAVEGTANGPSCFRLERLEESIVLSPPTRARSVEE